MQFSIFSDKITRLSKAEFKHEFRDVHARDTREMANSLGIISSYVQGLYLPDAFGCTPLRSLPLAEPSKSYQSLAQLTWPSVGTLQAALHTSGYRNSAGKHEFAEPQYLFLTSRLEPDSAVPQSSAPDTGTVMLVFRLVPISSDEVAFQQAWDEHANLFRPTCGAYQRNKALQVSQAQVQATFADTQFPPSLYCARGGYEEFIFASIEEAQSFCDTHGEKLAASYKSFCSTDSWCAMLDRVVQYGDSDRGLKQRIAGTIIGGVLSTKTALGL